MVRDSYRAACRYNNINILTNMSLYNFPSGCTITKLRTFEQIINAERNTIVIIDEISSLFNARKWQTNGIPDDLMFVLLQIRKRNIQIFATAQFFSHVDVFFRSITFTVRACQCIGTRMNIVTVYDGRNYEQSDAPRPIKKYKFVQTDELRALYNTNEFVTKIKNLSDDNADDELEKIEAEAEQRGINIATVGRIKAIKNRKKQSA